MASNSTKRPIGQADVAEGLVVIPTGLTALTTTDTWVFQIAVANSTAGALTLLVTDTQASPLQLVPTASVPGNSFALFSYPEGVKLIKGMKWQASGTGLHAEVLAFKL